MAEARRNVNVAIIGAGAAGIAFAIALKKQHGFKNFVIYDKGSEVGGTWRDNIYPGCSSDVPMVLYSLSSETKYDWPQSHGSQEEIFEYWKEVARKNNLYSHISFNHLVSSAKWNSDLTLYEIGVTNTITGEHLQRTANILVSAVGVLENPRFADIPGVGTFKGDIFHSARWDKSVDLRGKRVAVIGNGSSAAQFVPKITNDPSVYVVNFVRSPGWLWRPIRVQYSPFRRWLFRQLPFLNKLFRLLKFLRSEFLYFAVLKRNSPLHPFMTRVAKSYMVKTAPKHLVKDLIPDYPMGCKRLIFDTGYLEAMHRPNLKMNFDGIESIVEDGIVTKKNGEHIPFDVMIFATGYAADKYSVPIYGSDGKSIQEFFDEDGAKAYLGTSVPNFPNLFLIWGPNTVTGHTSAIFTSECQVRPFTADRMNDGAYQPDPQTNYSLQLAAPILEGRIKSIDVKRKVFDEYNEKIQSRFQGSVMTQCTSWYRAGKGGKITNMFPGSGIRFWWWLLRANFDDYVAFGSKSAPIQNFRPDSSRRTLRKSLFIVSFVLALARFLLKRGSLSKVMPVLSALLDRIKRFL